MILKAGILSLLLLLVSRSLGVVRESVQAATFGTTGMGDLAVLMFTLPDWLTGVVAGGALGYVLLPRWATQSPRQQARTQRGVAFGLLAMGVAISALWLLFQAPLARLLLSGIPPTLMPLAAQGLALSALAIPAAMVAALWTVRLQHKKDFVGMFAANIVVNIVLIIGLVLISNSFGNTEPIYPLALTLVLAMGLRLMWLYVRLGLPQESNETKTKEAAREPATGLWVWAAFSAGLPMVLPFVARTYASNAGEGALATFNYAWKLVELPLVLAIQLVATVTFPVIARGMAPTPPDKEVTQQISQDTGQAIRGAFLLAWTLACAAITALQVGAYLVADLLFGWGRMPAESVTNVAEWGTLGAWSLLPQSLIAVALTVMATLGRMRHIAVAYAAALIVFWVLGTWTNGDGTLIMVSLVAVLSFVACVATYAMHKSCAESSHEVILLPWQSMVTPTAAMLGFVFACQSPWLGVRSFRGLTGYAFCAASALGVFAISYLTNRDLRDLLRR